MGIREGLTDLLDPGKETGDADFNPTRAVRECPPSCSADSDQQRAAVELSEIFDETYSVMMAILGAAIRHPIPGDGASEEDLVIARYERITLSQTGLASMLYIFSPFGNALAQIPSGYGDGAIAPRFEYKHFSRDWDALVAKLKELSARAIAVAPLVPEDEIWLQPTYLAFRENSEPDQLWPRLSARAVIHEFVGLNLGFVGRRLENVRGAIPQPNPQGELHSCMGLNDCAGLDILGSAEIAGAGECATGIPHTCANLSQGRFQAMCGVGGDQGVPGANIVTLVNPADGENTVPGGGCQMPALPSGRNTGGDNTPVGRPEVFAQARGNVWRRARILFEGRMKAAGKPFGGSRGPGGVGGNDFPGDSTAE